MLLVVLLMVASLAVVVVVLALVGLATGPRLKGGGGAPGGLRPVPGQAAKPGPALAKKRTTVARDKAAEDLGPLLATLADAARQAQGDDDEEEPDSAEFRQKLEGASELFPLNTSKPGEELPDDLELPEESRVILIRGGPPAGQALVMARVPGNGAKVREFFEGEARARKWKWAELPAKRGADFVTLQVEKQNGRRMITIRPAPNGQECVVAVCDF